MSKMSRLFMVLVLGAVMLLSAGCDDNKVMRFDGLYDLRLSLGGDYRAPFEGESVEWALIRAADQVELARGEGVIAASGNPVFTMAAPDSLEFGVDYEFRYWIDSNTGGGTAGVCDIETIDYQWNYQFRAPMNDVRLILTYDETRTLNVCATFIG